MSLSLDSIRHPSFEADGLKVAMTTGRTGEADIVIDRLKVLGIEYRKLALHCTGFQADLSRIDCPHGEIVRRDERGQDRLPLPLSFSYDLAAGDLDFRVSGAEAAAWSPLVKHLRAWKPAGTVDLHLQADRDQARLQLAIHQLKFGNAEGDIAAQAIEATLEASAQRKGSDWHWQAQLHWPQGEAYFAPWYRQAGIDVVANGMLSPESLDVAQATFSIRDIGDIRASVRWDREAGALSAFAFDSDTMPLAVAFRDWLQPWLDQSGVPKVQASGNIQFAGAWANGEWQTIFADVRDAHLVDGTGMLEVRGVNAHIPWSRDVSGEAEFSVASMRLGELPLGGFRLPVHLRGSEVEFAKLSMPLLDGRLYIDELRASRHEEGWRGHFAGGMEGISMPKLTHALKLPPMAGFFTVNVPAAEYRDRVLTLGGAAALQVFDGGILVDNLKVIDPLTDNQRFLADVRARNLDLGMLTQAFSFGSILGRLDIDLTGLELAGWQPTRFDARVENSAGEYRRAISRGALIDISAIGGAPGAAAVSLSPARFFNTFDYERIGFTCALRGNTCDFAGIAPRPDGGNLLVQGRGIPSVQVVGYNRKIDWNLLVSRVRAVIAGKSQAVIE